MRQTRWIELFNDYECKIRYHLCKENIVVDALKRGVQGRELDSRNVAWPEPTNGKEGRWRLSRSSGGYDTNWVIVDRLTKSAHFLAIREDCKMEKLTRLYIDEIVARHGVSVSIITNYDRRFTSRFWKTLQKALGMRFGYDWDVHLPLAEFSYNNCYHSSIRCAPFEALCESMCRSPVLWAEIRESRLIGPELVQETTDKVVLIKENLKAVRDCQKSYADNRRKLLEFEVEDQVLLKVSPWKDANLHVHLEETKVDKMLCFVEEPVEIIDFEPELRTIVEMADNRTIEELLQAPTEGNSDDRIDKLADQILTFVYIFAKKIVAHAPVKAVEESCVTCGGNHAYYNCPNIDSNQPSVCVATGTYNQVTSQNRTSNFMAPPGFAPVQNGQNSDAPKKASQKAWRSGQLSLPELTPIRMTLELVDRSITRPKGVIEDVFVKVGKFHFPTDFVVMDFEADPRVPLILGRSFLRTGLMDFEADPRVPLILGRSFLRTGRALIDVYGEEITFRVNDEAVTFDLNQTMRYSSTYDDLSVNQIDNIDVEREEYAQEFLGADIAKTRQDRTRDYEECSKAGSKDISLAKRSNPIGSEACQKIQENTPECEGPLRGGFCWFCASNSEISFNNNPNPNSFDDSQNLSDYSPQPQYETYPCELCGNDSHNGYDCPPWFPFVYEQEPCYNQNYNENYYPHNLPSLLCCDNFQKEQEKQAVQSFTPYWNFSMNNDDEEHSIQYKEYLKNSSNTIAPVLPTEEPEYSLSMGYEHLSTISETESDEVIESSANNLVPIPSEYGVTSNDESECDVPVKDESSSVFTTFSNSLFDCNDDFTSSDDESLSNEDVLMEDFKVYSNPLFDDEEINSDKLDPHYFNAESDFIESLSNHDTLIDSSPKFDYLKEFSGELMPTSIVNEERIKREHEEYISLMEKLLTINSFPRPLENFHANTINETLLSSPIPFGDSNSLREEIDIFTGTDDLMPPRIESDDYDSEGDIHFLKELLSDDSIPLPKNKSSNFDHPSFPRPPPEPPDVEILFDFEPNSGEVISAVMNNIDELNEDECFDLGGEIDVL
nr:reverse transcriptase domain-containing protein [Tanacetum cinerariifolium]